MPLGCGLRRMSDGRDNFLGMVFSLFPDSCNAVSKFYAYPFDIRAGELGHFELPGDFIIRCCRSRGGYVAVVYPAVEGGELFSQFFEKFDNRVRVHRYCRLKSVLFSLFALLFLTALFFVRIVDRLQKIFEQVTERCGRIACGAAFVCGESLLAVQAQCVVDFGETELPVDFRAVERIAVLGENDALRVEGSAAHLKFCGNPLAAQRGRQLWPVATAGYGVVQCMVNLVFRLVRFAQAVLLDILFTRCEVELVPSRQFLAEALRAVAVVAVGDGTTVVVYPIEEDVQVGVFPVVGGGDDELRITDAHTNQIVRGYLDHPLVVELCGILCREGEGDVSDGFRVVRVECRLHLETAGDGFVVSHPDAQPRE